VLADEGTGCHIWGCSLITGGGTTKRSLLPERTISHTKIVSSVQIHEKTKKYRCLTFEILKKKSDKKLEIGKASVVNP
jgi:hypothetical protein